MDWSIREGTAEDAPAVSKICLSTGNAGKSAEGLYSHPELLGLRWAEPYSDFPPRRSPMSSEWTREKGSQNESWAIFVALWTLGNMRRKLEKNGGGKGTERDIEVRRAFARPTLTPDAVVAAYPAHMHINLLPEAQRKGWGRRLIDKAAEHIRRFGGRGVHLMIDPNNDEARQFYKRIGFVGSQNPVESAMGWTLSAWGGAAFFHVDNADDAEA
ncbi:hypothetical protein BS47DRAFT_1489319 [Hydnum rufescens UP504]|uniref:N-acetyltransferase domain-containing protein n=1 Tax=Hydnum rufescens UP504 TaxID=1448309 RepID=A0A9P6AIP8_9AGAM|nr:hypothetical protein BS47DRAFT_1489319 [Hydnum rufescens UP504]